jgi:hypothetical protein
VSGWPDNLISNSGVFPGNSVLGKINKFVPTATGGNLVGWACSSGVSRSIDLHVYAGGAAGIGRFLKSASTNVVAHQKVSLYCRTSNIPHRFEIPFTFSEIDALNGRKLYVYGLSAIAGWSNNLLGNSGEFP